MVDDFPSLRPVSNSQPNKAVPILPPVVPASLAPRTPTDVPAGSAVE